MNEDETTNELNRPLSIKINEVRGDYVIAEIKLRFINDDDNVYLYDLEEKRIANFFIVEYFLSEASGVVALKQNRRYLLKETATLDGRDNTVYTVIEVKDGNVNFVGKIIVSKKSKRLFACSQTLQSSLIDYYIKNKPYTDDEEKPYFTISDEQELAEALTSKQ